MSFEEFVIMISACSVCFSTSAFVEVRIAVLKLACAFDNLVLCLLRQECGVVLTITAFHPTAMCH